jgi:hypothetical protein
MKTLLHTIRSWLYRVFIESDWDRINRERREQGKPPHVFW